MSSPSPAPQPHPTSQPAPEGRPDGHQVPRRPRPISASRDGGARPAALTTSPPASRAPVALTPADAHRNASFEQAARAANLDVCFAGHHRTPDGPRLHTPHGARPWIVAPLDCDPVIERDGRLAIPDAMRRRLVSLNGNWHEPLQVVLAHELAEGSTSPAPLDAVALLEAPSRPIPRSEAVTKVPETRPTDDAVAQVRRVEERAGRTIEVAGTVAKGAAFAAVAAPTAALAVSLAPLAIAGVAIASVANLDPIVFAVLDPTPSRPDDHRATWFEIARWEV